MIKEKWADTTSSSDNANNDNDWEETKEREMQDERKEHNVQKETHDKEEPMEVGTIKLVPNRNESMDEINKIEII